MNNHRQSRVRLLALVLAAVAVLGASCSNDSGTTSTKSPGGTDDKGGVASGPFADLKKIAAPQPCVLDTGVTDAEIKVGTLLPQSGPEAIQFASGLAGIKARFEQANQEGELGSHKLVLKEVDDAGDVARNGEGARQLAESDKVFGVIEMSTKADGSAQYLDDKGVPVTGWHLGVPAWAKHANMFSFRLPAAADPSAEYTDRYVRLVEKLGGTKVALVGGGNESSVVYMNRVDKAFGKVKSPASVVYKTTDVPLNSTEFTAVIQRIKESGADVLITGMSLLQNTALNDQLHKAGVDMRTLVFPGGYDPRVVKLPGIEGATFGLEFKPLELQKTLDTKSYRDFYKYLPADEIHGQVVYVGWLAANLFIEGLKQAGVACPTRKAFIANLRLLKGYTADGAFDPVDFSADYGHEFQCTYYVKVENAEFKPLFDGKTFCGKPVKF